MRKLIVRKPFLYTICSVLFERLEKVGWKWMEKGRKEERKTCFAVKKESKVRFFGAGVGYDAVRLFIESSNHMAESGSTHHHM